MDFSTSYQGVFQGEACEALTLGSELKEVPECSQERESYSSIVVYKIKINTENPCLLQNCLPRGVSLPLLSRSEAGCLFTPRRASSGEQMFLILMWSN